jgi:hypothetical protein
MTTNTEIYDNINPLPDIAFIAGGDKLLSFIAYHSDKTNLLNVIDCLITWYLSPFGDVERSILEYNTNATTGGRVIINPVESFVGQFSVFIPAADTLSLSGKYIQQIFITDYTGYSFRPGQGIIIITPAIQAE